MKKTAESHRKIELLERIAIENTQDTTEVDQSDEQRLISGICFISSLYFSHAAEVGTRKLNKQHGTHVGSPADKLGKTAVMRIQAIDEEIEGVSLAQLFSGNSTFSKRHPVATYHHVLTRLNHETPACENDEQLQRAHLERRIAMGYRDALVLHPEKLQSLRAREIRLTSELTHPFEALRSTLLEAVRGTNKITFSPGHSQFDEIENLFRFLQEQGTPLQQQLFNAQILGTDSPSTIHQNYRRIASGTIRGSSPDIYADFKGILTESFTGDVGDNLPLPNAEEWEITVPLSQVDNSILRLKNQVLEKTPTVSGNFIISSDNNDEDDPLERHFLIYDKTEKDPFVVAGMTLRTTEDSQVDVFAQLKRSTHFDWNLLKTPDELPELYQAFRMSTHYMLDLLNQALEQQNTKPLGEVVTASKREHIVDEVYTLRKELIKQAVDSSIDEEHPIQTEEIPPSQTLQVVEPDEVFREKLAGKYPQRVSILDRALERYRKKQRGLKKLTDVKGPQGNALFRLREGNYRVILEERVIIEEDGEIHKLEVVDVVDRKDSYR